MKKAKERLGRDIFMVVGGMHMLRRSDEDLQQVIEGLRALGVQKVGPTHCSGDRAIAKMKEAFGKSFVSVGVGRVIEVAE